MRSGFYLLGLCTLTALAVAVVNRGQQQAGTGSLEERLERNLDDAYRLLEVIEQHREAAWKDPGLERELRILQDHCHRIQRHLLLRGRSVDMRGRRQATIERLQELQQRIAGFRRHLAGRPGRVEHVSLPGTHDCAALEAC